MWEEFDGTMFWLGLGRNFTNSVDLVGASFSAHKEEGCRQCGAFSKPYDAVSRKNRPILRTSKWPRSGVVKQNVSCQLDYQDARNVSYRGNAAFSAMQVLRKLLWLEWATSPPRALFLAISGHFAAKFHRIGEVASSMCAGFVGIGFLLGFFLSQSLIWLF